MSFAKLDYQPVFIEGAEGRLFTFSCWPEQGRDCKKGVLLVPPFAEEMNKSRRMLMQQAKLLAQQGYVAMLVDLFGTGDSDGEFRDASWDGWCEDLCCAWHWLSDRGVENISIIALRTGALLAADLLFRGQVNTDKLVLWQPVVAGDLFLNQFFRIRFAAELSNETQGKGSVQQVMRELQTTDFTEIAGYMLSRQLFETLSEKKLLSLLDGFQGELHWCEVVPTADRPLTAGTQKVMEHFSEMGISMQVHKVQGHPFWGAAEIEDVSTLLELTCKIFSE